MINASRVALLAAAVAMAVVPTVRPLDFDFAYEGELPAELLAETRSGQLAELLQQTQPSQTAESGLGWIFPWMGEARQRGCTTIQLLTVAVNGTAKSLGMYAVPPHGEHAEWARGNLWFPYIKRNFDDKTRAQDPKNPKEFILFGEEDLTWVVFQNGKPVWWRPLREGEDIPTPYPPFKHYLSESRAPLLAICNDLYPSGIGRNIDSSQASLLSADDQAFLEKVVRRFARNKPVAAPPAAALLSSAGGGDDEWLPGPAFGSGCRTVWFLTPGVDGRMKGAGVYDLFKVTPLHSWGIYIKRDTKPDDGNWVLYLDDAFAWARFANKRVTHFLKDPNLDKGVPPPYPVTDLWKPANPGTPPVIPVCSDMFFARNPDADKDL